jgi:hypothetical protein
MSEHQGASTRELHNRAIKNSLGSICWGFSALAIGGGLWLLSHVGRFPEDYIFGDAALMASGLVLTLHGFLSLRALRTGAERAHRQLTAFTTGIQGTAVFGGAVLAAMLVTLSIMLPFGIDDRFTGIIGGVVLAAIAVAVTVSYYSRGADNSIEPAPTFFEHVRWSVGVAFSGSLAASMALLFGFASIASVREIKRGEKFVAVIAAAMATFAIWLFLSAIMMLRDFIKRYRGGD